MQKIITDPCIRYITENVESARERDRRFGTVTGGRVEALPNESTGPVQTGRYLSCFLAYPRIRHTRIPFRPSAFCPMVHLDILNTLSCR